MLGRDSKGGGGSGPWIANCKFLLDQELPSRSIRDMQVAEHSKEFQVCWCKTGTSIRSAAQIATAEVGDVFVEAGSVARQLYPRFEDGEVSCHHVPPCIFRRAGLSESRHRPPSPALPVGMGR